MDKLKAGWDKFRELFAAHEWFRHCCTFGLGGLFVAVFYK